MSTMVLFEHPLNEKMRTWLRIEFLLQQLESSQPVASPLNALSFFRHTTELLDIFERGDLRTDLLKELDRQQHKLRTWEDVPGVNNEILDAFRQQLKQHYNVLMAAPRTGQLLREDRLIALVRQRLSIPGGCCSFDLPMLHLWLQLSQQQRDQQIMVWINSLDPLRHALTLVLELIRQSGIFRSQTSLNGFYQDNAEGSDLLRLRLRQEDLLYPQISGHKTRYAIRFLAMNSEQGEVPARLDFTLACC